MTREEAGEVILIGKRYIDCERCKENFRSDCPLCLGWCQYENPDYVEACAVLGMESSGSFSERIQRALTAKSMRQLDQPYTSITYSTWIQEERDDIDKRD